MATIRVNEADGKSSYTVNFFCVKPEEFKFPDGATLSIEDYFEQGNHFGENLEKYSTPMVFRIGTAGGSIQARYSNASWRFRVFVEAKNHNDLIRCYDAIRAELGGETVVIADFPGNLCEALTAVVTAPFALATGIVGALTGSSKQ